MKSNWRCMHTYVKRKTRQFFSNFIICGCRYESNSILLFLSQSNIHSYLLKFTVADSDHTIHLLIELEELLKLCTYSPCAVQKYSFSRFVLRRDRRVLNHHSVQIIQQTVWKPVGRRFCKQWNFFFSSSSFSLLIFVLFLSHNIDLAFNIVWESAEGEKETFFFLLLIHTCAIDSLERSCCDLRRERENKKEVDFYLAVCIFIDSDWIISINLFMTTSSRSSLLRFSTTHCSCLYWNYLAWLKISWDSVAMKTIVLIELIVQHESIPIQPMITFIKKSVMFFFFFFYSYKKRKHLLRGESPPLHWVHD